MIILDTNVLSEFMRIGPDAAVIAWLDQQPRTSIWTTAITILEIRLGLDLMADGRRRRQRRQAFDRLIDETLERRVLPFDLTAADEAGTLMAARQRRGKPVDLRDTMIAGIALARRATLATRNTRHFQDLSVPLIDPWTA